MPWTLVGTIPGGGAPAGSAVMTDALSATAKATYVSSGSLVVPAGVTSLTTEAWGSGQGGAAGEGNTAAPNSGAGGAGADYVRSILAVTPGETLTVTVAGTTAAGAVGGDSLVLRGATPILRARGGGSSSTNIGSVVRTGGAGGPSALLGSGGGGGGAGGTNNNGTAGASTTAGTGGTQDGGNGGTGGASVGEAGVAGAIRGGGGGGGAAGTAISAGGAGSTGARGEVRLSWAVV